MDTSEQYVKLCEKATEIQPKEADGWLSGSHIGSNIYCCHISPMGKQEGIPDGYYYILEASEDTECSECGNKTQERRIVKYIWLPRQDQLQEMMLDRSEIDPYSVLLNKFIHTQISRTIGMSMEMMWLRFVMQEKYGKRWRNGEWVTT